ncbi:unknown [Azospirillum sp. CAG:260]|nr:unknown [Azospirillum sp. CAG:260]
MKETHTQYYYIKSKNLFAMSKGLFDNYLYKNDKWVEDTQNLVSDRLMGYDPTEANDSPYKIGNTDIMDDIEKITEDEFEKRCNKESK